MCVGIKSLGTGSKCHTSANPEMAHGCCGAMICIHHCQTCQVYVCNLACDSLWAEEQPQGDMEWDPGGNAAHTKPCAHPAPRSPSLQGRMDFHAQRRKVEICSECVM